MSPEPSTRVDLRAAVRRGGDAAAVVELLTRWWRVDVPVALVDEVDILRRIQSPQVLDRLPWPQDVMLPPESKVVAGGEAIAEENQHLWDAVLRDEPGPVVEFIVDDEARAVDGRMPLGAFLLRLLVESAVYSADARVRCVGLDDDVVRAHLLADAAVFEPALVTFPRLIAGRGWFGLVLGYAAVLASDDRPEVLAADMSSLGNTWERSTPPPRA